MSDMMIDPQDLLNKILQKSTEKREGSYEDASSEVQDQAQRLIATCPELSRAQNAAIKYLFKTGNWHKWGECSRTTGKWRKLTGFDFVIVLHKEAWVGFTPMQREALLHHELAHIDIQEDKWCLAKHDVEEFLSTYKRFGSWRAELEAFRLVATEMVSATQ
jgi:hypothetical protein